MPVINKLVYLQLFFYGKYLANTDDTVKHLYAILVHQ
jgi:hypothetical protein